VAERSLLVSADVPKLLEKQFLGIFMEKLTVSKKM